MILYKTISFATTIKHSLVIIIMFLTSVLFAQPEPCPIENPEMTPTCAEACIICDIDGFKGRHQSDVVGSLPNDFCTLTVHNGQWIAFQAASVDLEIELAVSNCDLGTGLELALYRSLDCENFTLISNCFGGANRNAISEGESGIIRNTEPLVIGQYYYLTMDGGRADNCDWEFKVLQGSTEVAPLSITAPIEGDSLVCVGVMNPYTTIPEEGAVLFDWTLDGQIVGDNTMSTLDLTIDNPGTYNLCVTGKNACDQGTTTCKSIEVKIIPDTEISKEICEGQCFVVDGIEFCDAGTFQHNIILENGCDSTLLLNLVELEQPVTDIAFNLCEGDTIFIGNIPYFTTGLHSNTVMNALECDSLVNLDLNVITCVVESSNRINSVICNGGSDGSIQFSVTFGDPPFSYTWQHLQANTSGNGSILDLNEEVTIDNLPTGDLVIEINDDFGFMDVILAQIIEPEPLVIQADFSDYNGFNISCNNLSDGNINVLPSGGVPPYSHDWSTGENSAVITDIAAGNYTVSVTDNLGCQSIQNFEIVEPEPIETVVSFSDPNCTGLQTGGLEIISTIGGAMPYRYAINNSTFTNQIRYNQLSPGLNELVVIDANMCLSLIHI